jgi:hypothetical protein
MHKLLFPEFERELAEAKRILSEISSQKDFLQDLAAKLEKRLAEIERKIVASALNAHVRSTNQPRNWPAHLRAMGVRDETLDNGEINQPDKR